LTRAGYAGIVLGFVGLAFLIDPFGEGSVDRLAALVIVLGAMSWSAGSLYSRGAHLPKRPLVSAGLGAFCGGLLGAVVAVLRGEIGEAEWTSDAVLALGYLIVAGSLVGFTAYVWLLRSAPTSLVSTYAYVNPIVAVALGWLLLGESITLQMVVAGAAVLGSVAMILRSSRVDMEPGRGLFRRRPVPAATAEPTA
jgi:drug/metabolite transporter (DMT)-like permease